MNPYREPYRPGTVETPVRWYQRRVPALASFLLILLAASGAQAVTPSLRVNGIKYPDGTNAPNVFNVKAPECGAKGDGTTDDTAAIQACVNLAQTNGGTVWFPTPAIYKVTSTITIKSIYPVNLLSNMYGYTDNQTTGSFIRPGANFAATSMFHYEAPSAPHASQHGAGRVEGLAFYDNTNTNHTVNYTMLAALDLYDFNLGTVHNCYFHVLNGGAIRAISMVKGDISNVDIEFSGTGSQPALSLESLSGNNVVQSTAIHDIRMEYNYGTYLGINVATSEVKISHAGFEADTATASTDNLFIDNHGQHIFISDVHMNRNTFTQINSESDSNFLAVSGLQVWENSAKTANNSVILNGADHIVNGLSVVGATAQSVASVVINGARIEVHGLSVSTSGPVTVSNQYNKIMGATMRALVSASGNWAIDVTGINQRIFDVIVFSPPANMGAIRVSGAAQATSVANCHADGVSGTAPSAFRDESSSNQTAWVGNHGTNNNLDFTATATGYTSIANEWTTAPTSNMVQVWGYNSGISGGVDISGSVYAGSINGTGAFFGNRFDRGASGSVTICDVNASSCALGSASVAVSFTGGANVASGKVLDCSSCTLNLGVTNSTATSISKTGTTMTVNGSLRMNQGFAPHYRAAATTVTAANTDRFIGVNGSGARTVNLFAASTCIVAGQEIVIQEIGGSTGTITINPSGADLINGVNSAVTLVTTAYGRRVFICDGTSAWYTNAQN